MRARHATVQCVASGGGSRADGGSHLARGRNPSRTTALEEALLSEVAPVVRTDRLAVGLPHLPFALCPFAGGGRRSAVLATGRMTVIAGRPQPSVSRPQRAAYKSGSALCAAQRSRMQRQLGHGTHVCAAQPCTREPTSNRSPSCTARVPRTSLSTRNRESTLSLLSRRRRQRLAARPRLLPAPPWAGTRQTAAPAPGGCAPHT